PTTNFVFQNSGDSIATVTANSSTIGNSLGAGATYPAKGQAPISLTQANETGVVKITINDKQLDNLQDGTEILNLETTQNRGQYATLDASGNPVTDPSKQWDPIRTNVDAVSGSLTLNLGTGKDSLERRVAAKNPIDPEDKTPEITIKEAIKKAFNAKEKDGRLYHTDRDQKDIFIDEPAINLITDENTKKEIESQLSQMPGKKIYDVKWKRGMKITLHVPTAYYDFESGNQGWTYSSNMNGGHTGKKNQQIGPNSKGFSPHYRLKKYTNYTARAYVRTSSATGSNDVKFFIDNNNGDGNGAKLLGKVQGNQWKLVEFSFNTGNNPEHFKYLGFHNVGNANLQFDDVSLTEWKSTEDIGKAHVFEKWEMSPSGWMTGVTFKNVPSSKIRYQWFAKTLWQPIQDAPPVGADGKRTIQSPIIGINETAELYAVDEKDDNLKVKIATYDASQLEQPIKDAHKVDSWIKQQGIGNMFRYLSLQLVPNHYYQMITSYKIRVNGKSTHTVSRPNPSNNKITFDLYGPNGNMHVSQGGSVELWAVVSGRDIKVLHKFAPSPW
ncbi:binary toxin-like calcium binding domain-containing protein, partial [Bacillus mycoides]